MCFSHKRKCQVPYEFTFTNALGVLYHYPLHYMYMTLKNIFNLSNNTYSFKVFHNEIWGKISYYPVLPSTAISGSIAQPGKTRVFPPGFSPGGQYFANLEAFLLTLKFCPLGAICPCPGAIYMYKIMKKIV